MRSRRLPPLQNCVGCRGNPKRTYSKHYLCAACRREPGALRELVPLPVRPSSQLRELPGERFEDMFAARDAK